jgi:large subunit ribosomal protein L15
VNMHELQITRHTQRKRVGRGISAGGGKTAGRGTKGQNSRSGGQRNPGFEGGQTPLYQRLPRLKGFRSSRPKSQVVHTSSLDALASNTTISIELLVSAGLISTERRSAKLLYDRDPTKAHKVALPAASRQAISSLERAGGTFSATPIKLQEKTSTAGRQAKPRPPRRTKDTTKD